MISTLTSESPAPSIAFISGSPRPYGNASTLIETLVSQASSRGFSSTVIAPLQTLSFEQDRPAFTSYLGIRPCTACGGCSKTATCVIDDAMHSILATIARVDALVWVSPVYFSTVTAQLKTLMDRCQPWFAKRQLGEFASTDSRRPAGIITLGSGDDPYGAQCAITPLTSVSHILEFNPVTSVFLSGVERAGSIADAAHREQRDAAKSALDAVIDAVLSARTQNASEQIS